MSARHDGIFRSTVLSHDLVELGGLFVATGIADIVATSIGLSHNGVIIVAVVGGLLIVAGAWHRMWLSARHRTAAVRSARIRTAPSVADQYRGDGVLWQIRTTVADTPGRLAALCTALADLDVNILAIQVHPVPDAVVDEFLVMVPSDVDDVAIGQALTRQGGIATRVWRADVHDLVDVPTWVLGLPLRAGGDEAEILAQLLHATVVEVPGDAPPGDAATTIRVTTASGRVLDIRRPQMAFTPTERGRATAMAALGGRVTTCSCD